MTQAEAIQILLQQGQAFLVPKQYRAVENIDGGDFVTLFFYTNTEYRIRKATGVGASFANGYIRNPVLAGDFAWFHPLGGLNDCLSGLVFGQTYYLDPSQPGKVTINSPTGTDIIQIVGKAINGTILDTKINYLLDGTGGSAVPSGPAGGDLSGSYPNPTVVWANGYSTYDSRYVNTSGDTMTGALILNADPLAGLGAATKQYVDNLINGIDWKEAAHVGTVAALPAYTVSGGGLVLTGNINGAIPTATTDGHTLLVNERLLVKDEIGANLPNNGIYELTQVGNGSSPFILTRTADANTSDLLLEATISVIYGSTLANSIWHLSPAAVPIVIGTTNLSWVQVGGSGITTLNTLTAVNQSFATGTTGTDFNISSVGTTHTFNIPTASALTRGALSSFDWGTFNGKEPGIPFGTTAQYWRGDKTWQTLPTVTPSALTEVDDTNVTLTLGGSPSTALLQPVSLTLGWTGTLADSRITSAATWNAKIGGKIYKDHTDATAVTGTTANTLVKSVLIPGGTFVVGDILSIIYRVRKVGTGALTQMRIYINTTATIAGATVLATNNTAAGTLFSQITREAVIKTATNTEVFTATNTAGTTDMINATGAASALNIDWTTDKYFIFAIQNNSTTDSTTASMYNIKMLE